MKNIEWMVDLHKINILQSFSCLDENAPYDIAVARLDRSIEEEEWNQNPRSTICPICLPDDDYKDIGKTTFVLGFGLIFHASCHTGGAGPDQFTQCAPGSIQKEEGRPDYKVTHWTLDPISKQKKWFPGCKTGYPPVRTDIPCRLFNRQFNESVISILNEVVLEPKDKSKKPYKCFSLTNSYNGRLNEGLLGWCGTCDFHAKESGRISKQKQLINV